MWNFGFRAIKHIYSVISRLSTTIRRIEKYLYFFAFSFAKQLSSSKVNLTSRVLRMIYIKFSKTSDNTPGCLRQPGCPCLPCAGLHTPPSTPRTMESPRLFGSLSSLVFLSNVYKFSVSLVHWSSENRRLQEGRGYTTKLLFFSSFLVNRLS